MALWWPAGAGAQPLFSVNVSLACGAPAGRQTTTLHGGRASVSATRRIGFRHVALVTGNDTDAGPSSRFPCTLRSVLGFWGKTMRDAVRSKEGCTGRRAPSQDPSTHNQFATTRTQPTWRARHPNRAQNCTACCFASTARPSSRMLHTTGGGLVISSDSKTMCVQKTKTYFTPQSAYVSMCCARRVFDSRNPLVFRIP